ncbi:hypothetical protein [Hydrogenophilus thermoluteolus]|uniref:Rhodanese domain-containing protein n=1 Tax=Hydrogenophilus thermoluteolus TaxID=297 RepID=A0A2Z6DVQ6_HYDTE|nr:hypothetical protein [Hydrogenophilus thermoluteolus]BBD76526.1 hypothetical protein HPTL_0256 [Hydrogenophilus thermoluteolus]
MKTTTIAAFFLLLWGMGSAQAGVTPMKTAQLVHALEEGKPCCVIDGRPEQSQRTKPLENALPYRDGLVIEPSGMVVVVADSDEAAMRIASRLDESYPGQNIVVVLGGADAWEAAQVELSRRAAAPPRGLSFIIPKNTCESGSSIQKLTTNGK